MSREALRRLGKLGRQRLSRHFTMRQFLYSEIANAFGMTNIPDDEDLALEAGRHLAQTLLDPLMETFGGVEIRSAYRSPNVNRFGNENRFNCASNARNAAHHIWDLRDGKGRMGATACIYIPWFTAQFDRGRDWRDLAYWLHDHLDYSEIVFFRSQCSFNLNSREDPARSVKSWISDDGRGGCRSLISAGVAPTEDATTRKARYFDFPAFRGLSHPVSADG